MIFQLEICCYNIRSALIAQELGAHRVELCAGPLDGGTTPSSGTIKTARKKLQIPLFPIIRPRGSDFLFSDEEFEVMLHDIDLCKQLGCDGIVTGVLQPDGNVDRIRMTEMVERAYPLGVTFHRAFDWALNPFEALEDIIETGCERILTSGQQPTAIQGAALIADLVRQADNRIIIMPGSGIRSSNISDLVKETGASEYHSSARIRIPSEMRFTNISMNEEQVSVQADPGEIEAMVKILEQL